MLHAHYAYWLEDRRVNTGQWWSVAALVGVLAALVFDQTYDFCCFPADKSMRKQWIIDMR